MRLHPLIFVSLTLLVSLAIGGALLQFRLSSSEIPRTVVSFDTTFNLGPLDQVLLENLSYLSRSNSFDSLFVPNREVTLEPFHIQRCEVSQSDFNRFAQWQQFDATNADFIHPDAPPQQVYRSDFFEHTILGKLRAPVTGVDFYQASAYCAAAGGRLPTNDEWEAAASGTERRLYPWGNSFNPAHWQYRNPLLNVAQSCGTTKGASTPNGIADLGGGASEWVTDTTGNKSFLRGGNALNKPYALHALNLVAKASPPNVSSQFIGFRCAFDVPQPRTPWGDTIPTAALAGGSYQLGTPREARIPFLAQQLERKLLDIEPLFEQTTHQAIEVSTYEITVAQYARFLRDPLVALGFFANQAEPSGHSYVPLNWAKQKNNPHHPVVGVSWWDAYAYANWVGGRLPTMQEWNRLFTSATPRLYPWGDSYQPQTAIVRDNAVRTAPVTVTESKDRSPDGLYGLAGNVSEWTSSVHFGNTEHSMVIKGGNFLLKGSEAARFDYIARAPAYYRSPAIGFRVIFM